MATITLYELGNYNNGCLIHQTFLLDTFTSHDDWLEAVASWLNQLTEETGQLCEEWIVADVEDVPRRFVGEYSLDADYWAYREALESSCLNEAVFIAAAELDIPPDMVEGLYQGEYGDDQDFAYARAEDLGLLLNDVQWPYTSIDWESAARDLMYDYGESDGHYFRTSY